MKIAIVDDVDRERKDLAECLQEWAGMNRMKLEIEEFSTGEDFMKRCEENLPAVVFMDIYLERENGLKVIENLRKISTSCITIFITSSRGNALKAFPLHPFDYVVKPWNRKTIFRVMDDLMQICMESDKTIELTVGRQKLKLPVCEIGYAVSDNHHVRIYTKAGEEIKSFSTFRDVSAELKEDRRFLICNRGIIVNMDYIDQYSDKCFVMKNGTSLPLKVKDIPVLEKKFSDYIFEQTRRWKS